MYCDCNSQFDHCEEHFDEPVEDGEYTIMVDVLGVTVKLLVTVYKDEDGRSIDLDDERTMQKCFESVEWLGSITSHNTEYLKSTCPDDGFDTSDNADLVYRVHYLDGFECIGGPDDERAFDLLRQKEHEAELYGGSTIIVTADWDDLGRGSVYIGFLDGFSLWVDTPDWESFATLVSALDCGDEKTVLAFPYCRITIGEALDNHYDE